MFKPPTLRDHQLLDLPLRVQTWGQESKNRDGVCRCAIEGRREYAPDVYAHGTGATMEQAVDRAVTILREQLVGGVRDAV